jgi:hypothetical protein
MVVDPKCGQAKNKIAYAQLSTTIIFQQFDLGQAMENKRRLVHFASIFSLLSKGKPMINHEDFKHLFKFLKF